MQLSRFKAIHTLETFLEFKILNGGENHAELKMAKVFYLPNSTEAERNRSSVNALCAKRNEQPISRKVKVTHQSDGFVIRLHSGVSMQKHNNRFQADDDHRARLLANCFAAIMTVILMITGFWAVYTIFGVWPE